MRQLSRFFRKNSSVRLWKLIILILFVCRYSSTAICASEASQIVEKYLNRAWSIDTKSRLESMEITDKEVRNSIERDQGDFYLVEPITSNHNGRETRREKLIAREFTLISNKL